MARPRAGMLRHHGRALLVGDQLAGAGVEPVDQHLIGAEIGDQDEAAID
jgi:hypothetical protein